LTTQEQLMVLARDLALTGNTKTESYRSTATELLRENAPIVFLTCLDKERQLRWPMPPESEFVSTFQHEIDPLPPEIISALDGARHSLRPQYSKLFVRDNDQHYIFLAVPVHREGYFLGTVGALYSVNSILHNLLPKELAEVYRFSLVDAGGRRLVSTTPRATPLQALNYEVMLDPPGHSLMLRAEMYPQASNLTNNVLVWLVGALSVFVLWSLWTVWRHVRERFETQQALVAEMTFRRAMENSMLNGMRTIDFEGRITYVNPAFCRMTGWNEADLLGKLPPYPYWPSGEYEKLDKQIQLVLGGHLSTSGYEMRVQRPDGSTFYARMHVSALVDAQGAQSGWMGVMTDITEPRRAREALVAAQERFTTVLESLDAAVSVIAPNNGHLLFANRYYQQIFGGDAGGHLLLSNGEFDPNEVSTLDADHVDGFAGLPAGALMPENSSKLHVNAEEVFISSQQRWFEVRRRYIQWVDGHLAQMLIATDITQRKAAAELARQHEEKLQFTSRLTTMGEMASSLAHELNQPLAAINNYCMGAVSRLKAGRNRPEDLLPALEKAAAQAVRAGTVIQRIRSFVKRSQPQQRDSDLATILADAIGLAEIEAHRRGLRIQVDAPDEMIYVYVDPVLIEQVLVNLLKNAAEAMGSAQSFHKNSLAVIVVKVYRIADEWGKQIAIDVLDRGPGVDEALKERLFEPFFSTKAEGMGMGLNICRSIIESHKGRLWVENNIDSLGCTFKIRLPLV
jgi:PAS domain S-box-containing protein